MGKKLMISLLTICIAAFFVLFAGQQAIAANSDLYYFNDVGSFDLHSLKNVSSLDAGADIRYGTTGSKWYFIGLNGASINDMGAVDFNVAKLPDTGYTIDRTDVIEGHVYAVKCGDGSYRMMKVTSHDNKGGSTEFMVRTAEPEKELKLYYLNGDYLRFDFETLKNVTGGTESDLYFRYTKTSFVVENGATVKDLGIADYESVKAPPSGYQTGEVAALKGHVYVVKTDSNNAYVIKITNVISESEVEFMARKADVASSDTDSVSPGQTGGTEDNIIDLVAVPIKGTVYLDWSIKNPGDIDGYNIYRANVSGGYTEPMTDFPLLKREFTNDTVKPGVTYYYIVKAVLSGNQESGPSNEVMVTVKNDDTNNNSDQAKTVIILQLGNPMMKVNGVDKEVDPGKGTVPIEINGRTMIPIRAIVEALGGDIGWIAEEKKITITLGEKNLELWLDKKFIKVNGVQNGLKMVLDWLEAAILFLMIPKGYTTQFSAATGKVLYTQMVGVNCFYTL